MTVEAYRKQIKDEKRKAALQAGIEQFLEHGYDCTTLLQVAKVAKISTGTLFKHFPTKAALFEAIMEEMWDTAAPAADQPLPKSGDPQKGLHEIGKDYARMLRQPNIPSLFRIIIAETQRFPELGNILYERGKASFICRLREYLETEVKAERLVIENFNIATRQFFGLISTIIFWPRLIKSDLVVTDADVERAIEEAIATFMARYSAGK